MQLNWKRGYGGLTYLRDLMHGRWRVVRGGGWLPLVSLLAFFVYIPGCCCCCEVGWSGLCGDR